MWRIHDGSRFTIALPLNIEAIAVMPVVFSAKSQTSVRDATLYL